MKIRKIIGILVTVIAVAAVGLYLWQTINQKRRELSAEPIEDTRVQVTSQDNPEYLSSVLINSIEKQSEFGTGYVVGKNAVVTNRHVVEEVKDKPETAVVRTVQRNQDGTVTLIDFKIRQIVFPEDESIDVALLKLEPSEDGKTISDYRRIAEFGDSSKIQVGTPLTVVGFPGDKEYATMWAATGDVDMISGDMFSFRAVTAPGNSGSPLFDSEGKVVAMNNAGGESNSFGFMLDKTIIDFISNHIE